ncbi:MAG: zinc-binding dehydrogenase, partial [Xanthomonadales bacterium]|nr:zinc-binding dehydrogenase [Xanthomonadales bacterium]
ELLGWVSSGQLKPLISREYSLDQVPRALRDLAERRVLGKVVIVP